MLFDISLFTDTFSPGTFVEVNLSAIISFLLACVSVFCFDIIDHQNVSVAGIEPAIDDNKVRPSGVTHTLAFRKLKGTFEIVPVRIGLNESQDIVLVAEVQMAIGVKHG